MNTQIISVFTTRAIAACALALLLGSGTANAAGLNSGFEPSPLTDESRLSRDGEVTREGMMGGHPQVNREGMMGGHPQVNREGMMGGHPQVTREGMMGGHPTR